MENTRSSVQSAQCRYTVYFFACLASNTFLLSFPADDIAEEQRHTCYDSAPSLYAFRYKCSRNFGDNIYDFIWSLCFVLEIERLAQMFIFLQMLLYKGNLMSNDKALHCTVLTVYISMNIWDSICNYE